MTATETGQIDEVVESVRRGGTVGVALLVSGEAEPRYLHDAETTHYAASTMKLPILIAAQRLAERGDLDLDDAVVVHSTFDSRHPGHTFDMDESEDSDPETWAATGTGLPLRDLVGRMVTHSGNLATNLVLERVGYAEVAAVLEAAGCSGRTVVPRGIEDYPARDAGMDNLVTAHDLARVMVALAEGRLAGPGGTAECERILREQSYRDGIPAGLPADALVGNKTGWIDGVNHDVALVRAPGLPAIGLAVLCTVDGEPEEREAGIARITRAVWGLVTA